MRLQTHLQRQAPASKAGYPELGDPGCPIQGGQLEV